MSNLASDNMNSSNIEQDSTKKASGKKVIHCFLTKEFTAKDVQSILRELTGGAEKIGLALLNYYSRTNLVPATGIKKHRGRNKYSYSDLILLCWLFRMKREGLPVNRFRKGIEYLRKKLPKLHKNPQDMVMLTDGRNLFLKHRIEDKNQIAEVLTGNKTGQYVWMYAIGSLIEEVDEILDNFVEEDRVAA
jgi:DNA-binding transcriptional MerR regulator